MEIMEVKSLINPIVIDSELPGEYIYIHADNKQIKISRDNLIKLVNLVHEDKFPAKGFFEKGYNHSQ
jgi:hypothetical protein